MSATADAGSSSLDDPARLEVIRRTGLLDTGPEESFDRLTALAARLLAAPACFLSLLTDERQFLKSATGLPEDLQIVREIPLSHSCCRHVVEGLRPLVVANAREHPVLAGSPAIDAYDVVAYAGVPIMSASGHAIGSFCVTDAQPRTWSEQHVTVLEELAAAAAMEIELRRALRDWRERRTSRQDDGAGSNGQSGLLTHAVHELRTPLTAISGFSATMLHMWESLGDADRRELVQLIHDQSERLRLLVSELLVISRLDAASLTPRMQELDVEAQVRAAVHELGLDGDVRISAHAPARALGDAEQLQQILLAYLSNALKYGAPPVWIDVEPRGDWVEILVCDCGTGVPEAVGPDVFEEFVRAAGDGCLHPGQAADGTGLGLSIVRRLAAAQGGSCWHEPVQPHGACFGVRLPRADAGLL